MSTLCFLFFVCLFFGGNTWWLSGVTPGLSEITPRQDWETLWKAWKLTLIQCRQGKCPTRRAIAPVPILSSLSGALGFVRLLGEAKSFKISEMKELSRKYFDYLKKLSSLNFFLLDDLKSIKPTL